MDEQNGAPNMAREAFDGYGQKPPAEPWGYELDDHEIVYGPGWWPFYRPTHRGFAAEDDGPAEPASVRLAPNTEYRSWRNWYVLIGPGESGTAEAHITLYVKARGMGADVIDHVAVTLNIPNRTYALDTGRLQLGPELTEQAEQMAGKLLAFVLAARKDRRAGRAAPCTAYDRYMAAQAEEEASA